MPQIRKASKLLSTLKGDSKKINWHPGHMFSGMQAMIGKLNTVDCVVEVHDARIPFLGRNTEFRQHLGLIKPHLLVLNKRDLADLSQWQDIKNKLHEQGDENVLLTDMTGSDYSFSTRGYTSLLSTIVNLVNNSPRYNRQDQRVYKMMVVGIPNVGKSTLINRLRQHHLGRGGEPAHVGPIAGVTRTVANIIRVCSRPPIYSIDTPGVLQPGVTRNQDDAMRLALCSSINDSVLDFRMIAEYLLKYLNSINNQHYIDHYYTQKPIESIMELIEAANNKLKSDRQRPDDTDTHDLKLHSEDRVCRDFVRLFRTGAFGKFIFI